MLLLNYDIRDFELLLSKYRSKAIDEMIFLTELLIFAGLMDVERIDRELSVDEKAMLRESLKDEMYNDSKEMSLTIPGMFITIEDGVKIQKKFDELYRSGCKNLKNKYLK